MDEQNQLDQILSNLLNDQVNFSTKSAPPQTSETKSFKTWDAQTGSHGEVAFRVPLNVSTKSKSVSDETSSKPYIPKSAFTYTPPSPEFSKSHKIEMSSKSQTLPYRTDYDSRYNTDSYSYKADSSQKKSHMEQEHSPSWLDEQKQKLRYKQEGGDERHMQDKMLVQELKTAQNKYYTKRAENEADEKTVMNSYHTSPPPLSNGPSSQPNYSYTVSRTHTYSTSDPSPTGISHHDYMGDSQTSHSSKSYSTESRSYGSSLANKPPPSPVLQRSMMPTSAPPVPPPPRASSRDFMQQQQQQQQQQQNQQRVRSSSSSSWQSHNRPLNRQHSDSAYERDLQVDRQPFSYTASPPVHSPRSFSPTQQSYQSNSWRVQNSTQQVGRDNVDFGIVPPISPPKPTVTEVKSPDGKKQHYVTEVFVHRGGSK